jgi:hypothetical protein
MNPELIAAASLLEATLSAENAALTALDLPRAAAMLADKQRAVAGFVAALDARRDARAAAAQQAAIEPMARRLQALSEANRSLLERAIAVQGRVIGVIARAAAPAVAPCGYSGHGASGHPTRPTALALVARA